MPRSFSALVRCACVLSLLIIALSVSPHQAAQAAFLVVDQNCTLWDAITAANTNQPSGGCPAGSSGSDTIILSEDVTLAAVDNTGEHGPNGLPIITSDIVLRGNGYTLERSSEPGTPNFRLFEVAPEGRLRLENMTLRGGALQGGQGSRGGDVTKPGSDGEKGAFKLVAFFYVGEGHPGGDGGAGSPGRSGDPGQSVEGGAIYNQGELTLVDASLANHRVTGGPGGSGGAGSNGGVGGEGGSVGKIAPIIVAVTPGRGGNGGPGGSGGSGGDGGDARGGAIYNAGGMVTITNSTLSENVAQGGRGGRGGRGGNAGLAGDAGIDGTDVGPGGSGGRGGSGGVGGGGGASQGGAVYNAGGVVTITGSTFENNTVRGGPAGSGGPAGAGSDGGLESGDGGLGGPGGFGGVGGDGEGGGIYQADGTLTVERSSLLNLTAVGGPGGTGARAGAAGNGGDLFIAWGTLTSDATTAKLLFAFSGSAAVGYDTGGPGGFGGFGGGGGQGAGGSIYIIAGMVRIDGSTLANSSVDGGAGGKGGAGTLGGYNSDVLVSLYQWLIEQGWSEFRGLNPGENGSKGPPGTSGPGRGGAVYDGSGLLLIDSATLTGNTAGEGGAAWYEGIAAQEAVSMDPAAGSTGTSENSTIINSTIAGNTATRGGGIFAGGKDQNDLLAVGNTILATNHAATDPDLTGTILSLDYNLIGSSDGFTIQGESGHTLTGSDPQLDELDDYGGSTPTLALQVGSPAIDRGRCNRSTDQRGYYRVDGGCDIGAFEYGALATLPPSEPDLPANADAGNSIRASLPDGTYLHVIAADGVFVQNPGEVGVSSVLDRGVISAVDVFSSGSGSASNAAICLRGEGDLIFLAAANMPRTASWLSTVTHRDGYTCGILPGDGTLVLVAGSR